MNRIRISNFNLFRFGKFVIVVILVLFTAQNFIKINKINYNFKPFHPVFPSLSSTPSPNLKKFSFGEKCLNLSHMKKIHASDFANEDFEFLKTEEGKEYKKILFYFHNEIKNFWFGFGKKPFEAACCKEKRCFTTAQRDKIPIEDFDALMMHFQEFSFQRLPKKRARHQRYIFYEKESVPYTSRNLGAFEGIFNWTMTYRRDSDIYARWKPNYIIFPAEWFAQAISLLRSLRKTSFGQGRKNSLRLKRMV
ncbi:hypothetical protein Avbf_12816 [Armadillidium vulgare]|nr:hypothetical protein Avbf_12816 [Armadillidium vulgare]